MFTDRPVSSNPATTPSGVFINILDGVAGALALRTKPVTLKQLLGAVTDPATLLTKDMSAVQAPIFAMPIASNGNPNWHLSRTDVAAVAYTPTVDPNTKTFAGTPGTVGSNGGTGSAARFNQPNGMRFDSTGNLFIAGLGDFTLRKATGDAIVTTLAGVPGAAGYVDGAGSQAKFASPCSIEVDAAGNVYMTDPTNNAIRKTTPSGVVSTFVKDSRLVMDGIARDALGNFYGISNNNGVLWKITPAGSISAVAGTSGSFGAVDGTGVNARFGASTDGVAIDRVNGIFYAADAGNHVIRKVVLATGVVTTLAGLAGAAGSADGVGAVARFNTPRGLDLGPDGLLYVADSLNHTIRKVNPTTGAVSTIAGSAGNAGSTNGTGVGALFNRPDGIAVHPITGDVYVAENVNNDIRVIPNPNPPASSGDYAVSVSYGGTALPVMDNGIIPAGWRVIVASWGAMESGNYAGLSDNVGIGPRDIYFVPCFKAVDDATSLVHLGAADFSWTMHLQKPLNPGQNPKFAVTVTINGVTTSLTPTLNRNAANQITSFTVTIPGTLIQVAGSQGQIHVIATEALHYLKGTALVNETVTYLDKVFTETFSATSVTLPLISQARMLQRAECAATDQPSVLQWLPTPGVVWSVTENVWTRFSAKAQASNAQLARWELWWVPSDASRQNIMLIPAGWVTPPAGRNYTNMPARMLTQGNFAANMVEDANHDVRINTYDYWPLGCAGRGSLLLKVFDTLGNSKSQQVAPPGAGRDADGTFLNIGLTQYTERYVWSRGGGSEGGYLRCYVAGGPGPETRGAYYPAGYENFIASCGCINEGTALGQQFNYGLWLYSPWDFELNSYWPAGQQKIHFVIMSKSGRRIDDYLYFNVASFPVVSSCCFLDGTPVQTPDGDKLIESLKPGDTIFTYDFEKKQKVAARISGKNTIYRSGVHQVFTGNGDFAVTEDHALYAPNKQAWAAINQEAGQRVYGTQNGLTIEALQTGDTLLGSDGTEPTIDGIMELPGDRIVHTFSIEGSNPWFFAGGILAHNAREDNGAGSGGYDHCCLRCDTLVTTPSGPVRIDQIKMGDWVIGYDAETNQTASIQVRTMIQKLRKDHYCVKFEHGVAVYITDDHAMWSPERGWLAVDAARSQATYGEEFGITVHELVVGDFLLGEDGIPHLITQITQIPEEHNLYTLALEKPFNSFFANGIAVHNSCAGSSTCNTTTPTKTSCCVREDSLISTPQGDRPIKDLKVQDLIYSYDPATKQTLPAPIVKMFTSIRDHHFRLTFNDGSNLYISDDHPVGLADGRWAAMDPQKAQRLYGDSYGFAVDQLVLGDTPLGIISNKRIIGIDRINQTLPLYTFDVQNPLNTYFANGVMVHNNHN